PTSCHERSLTESLPRACRAADKAGVGYCFDDAGESGAPGGRLGGGPPHVHDTPKPSQPLISCWPVPYEATGGFGDVQPASPVRPVLSLVSTLRTNGSTNAGSDG